jgi:hypothetical protein
MISNGIPNFTPVNDPTSARDVGGNSHEAMPWLAITKVLGAARVADPVWAVLVGMTTPRVMTRWKGSCTVSPMRWTMKMAPTKRPSFAARLLLETIQ